LQLARPGRKYLCQYKNNKLFWFCSTWLSYRLLLRFPGCSARCWLALRKPKALQLMVLRTLRLVGPNGRPRAGVCVFPTTNPRLIAATDATGAFHSQVLATTGTFYPQADEVGLGSSRVAVDSQHPQPASIVLVN
jgi:hypothetical protein